MQEQNQIQDEELNSLIDYSLDKKIDILRR